jgi:methylmalonyl-CoA carboxyltransferase large subunit
MDQHLPADQELQALIAQMREQIAALNHRVNELELCVAGNQPSAATAPSEEELLIIAAAVAAYLGVRASIRQVRLVHSSAWGQVGRIGVHASHRLH